jgi:cytochrome c553
MLKWLLVAVIVIASVWATIERPGLRTVATADGGDRAGRYLRATYSPLHFRPSIESASDAQCLACHREVLDDKVRAVSPAGVKAADSIAWYQRLSTYQGGQDTFHRRHLVTPLAQRLMALRCNFCHEGHDPREEAPGSSATSAPQADAGFTLRKQVNPETTCLKCHGQMPWQLMTGFAIS